MPYLGALYSSGNEIFAVPMLYSETLYFQDLISQAPQVVGSRKCTPTSLDDNGNFLRANNLLKVILRASYALAFKFHNSRRLTAPLFS